jgi:hypothetical protein
MFRYLADLGSVVAGAAYLIEHDAPAAPLSPAGWPGCSRAARRFRDTGTDIGELAAAGPRSLRHLTPARAVTRSRGRAGALQGLRLSPRRRL